LRRGVPARPVGPLPAGMSNALLARAATGILRPYELTRDRSPGEVFGLRRGVPARAFGPLPAGMSNALLARPATGLLQRATRVNATLTRSRRGEGFLTQGRLYNVTEKALYASSKAPQPRRCKSMGKVKRGRQYFTKWVPDNKGFVADCLHTAEEIMHNRVFKLPEPPKEGTVRSAIVDGTGKKLRFGDTHQRNIKAVNAAPATAKNAAASAVLGEAFVIVETDETRLGARGAYPYHAAGVVAQDGQDKVTLEMFAGLEHATEEGRGDEAPSFKVYPRDDADSFHTYWQGKAIFTRPVTAVIKPAGR
jgi:hypothetical protein